MADRIIPKTRNTYEFNRSSAEERLYNALKAAVVDKGFTVIHSLKLRESEADFIILHRELGILLIEIKSGRWQFRNGKIMNDSGVEKDPEKQLKDCTRCVKEIITKLKLPKAQNGQGAEYAEICHLLWMPDTEETEGFRETGFLKKENLYLEKLYNAASEKEEIKDKIYKKWKSISKGRTALSDASLDKIANALCPEFCVADSREWAWKRTRALQNRLAARQEALLSLLKNQKRAVIRGGAGTGKTWLALKKARQLAEETGDGVCFTCFNDILRNDTDKQFAEYNNITVADLFEQYGIDPMDDTIPDKQEEIAKRIREREFPWRHVIIDEAQDFKYNVLEALFNCCADRDGFFLAFYDPNQLVHFDRTGKNWLQEDHPATAGVTLSRNLRNTAQIARTAEGYAELSTGYAQDTLQGMQPRVWLPREGEKAFDTAARILRRYEEDGLTPNNTAVLTMLGWDKALKELSDQPENLGELAIGDRILKRDPSLDLFADKSLIFTTVRKFKGMEADHVIILHAGEKLFTHSNTVEQLFYTACSRACLYLDTVLTPEAAREFLIRAGGRELTPELAEELLKMKAEICL
ncbi:MAG: DUF2075 domain-containing protein [Abditibacteriota bacterium]|nr:DUF2075 domain-containing protein [Abditibacteriota bacterium]